MNYKLLSLLLLLVVFGKDLLLCLLELRAVTAPIPENVQDVYDAAEYARWRAYRREKLKLRAVDTALDFAYLFLVLLLDGFARLQDLHQGLYWRTVIGFTLFNLVNALIKLPTAYLDSIRIEGKYGFNRATKQTFLLDQLKDFLVGDLMLVGLTLAFLWLYTLLGDWILPVFTAVAVVILLAVAFLLPMTQRLYNKFRPLEEGSLRVRLIALLEKHGYRVRDIRVMDASRRSTKANAYFSGMGKTKTIVLYDTILTLMDEDELVAVFAHELAHGAYRHLPKNMVSSAGLMFLLVFTVWGMLKLPICRDFGFAGNEPCLIAILLLSVAAPFVTLVYGLLQNWLSRRFEYEADAFAAREGWGEALITGLKKLARHNFAVLNPHPLLVTLSDSHPPLSSRIAAIRRTERETAAQNP